MNKKLHSKLTIILKKSLRFALWALGIIVILFTLLFISIQIPAVQSFAKNKAVSYLQQKIQTKVSVGRLDLNLPKNIVLENVYFEDQQKDTLLYGKKIEVNISLLQLFNNTVEINAIDLNGITATISKNKKAVFNFDYIIKAFSTKAQKQDTLAPMRFLIDKINLDNIKVNYFDASNKTKLFAKINHFDTKVKTFDLANKSFEIPKINLDGFKINFKKDLLDKYQTNAVAPSSYKRSNNATAFKLNIKEINFANIDANYSDLNTKVNSIIQFKKMFVSLNSIDLANQKIDIQTINLNGTKAAFTVGKIQKTTQNIIENAAKSKSWIVKVNKTNVNEFNFKFDNNNKIKLNNRFDNQHLNIASLNLVSDKLFYDGETASGNISQFSVNEGSNLKIESLKTKFYFGRKRATLTNFYLKTPNTEIKNQTNLGYYSVKSISSNPAQLQLKVDFTNSKVSFKDILYFAPDLAKSKPFKNNAAEKIYINGNVYGKLSALNIKNLNLSGFKSTKVAVKGSIIGLPNLPKTFFNIRILDLKTTANDVSQIVPNGSIPQTIQLPQQFSAKGLFTGTINNFFTNVNIISTSGNVSVRAFLNQTIKKQERYKVAATLVNFDIGKLLKNNAFGKISAKTSFVGVGFNPKTSRTKVDAKIFKAYFNNYNYQNLQVTGAVNNGKFKAKVNAKDPNLVFDMVSAGSLQGKYPSGKLNLNIDIADLNKLNLHAGPLKIRGQLNADVQSADFNFLNGTASATHFVIANQKDQFVLDSINIVATATKNNNSIILKSQFVNAEIIGQYNLLKIGQAVKNSISRYYKIDNYKKSTAKPTQFTAAITVKENKILYKLLPELKSFSPLTFRAKYNSVNDTIVLKGSIPQLSYGTNSIGGSSVAIDTKNNSLLYSVIIDDLQNANFQLPYASIIGKIEKNIIDYDLLVKDLKNKERYIISGTFKNTNQNSEVFLNPKNLMLNYQNWQLSDQNVIRFGKNGIYVNNFNLNNDGNFIKAQSLSTSPNAPLQLDFKNFDIETITNIAQKSNLQIGGKINGSILLKNILNQPLFTSDLIVDNFTFQKDTIGNLNIQVNNAIANTYTAKINITGFDNQVNLNGNYKAKSSIFDFDLDIQKLNVKSIQGFGFGNITESTGFLNGNLKIIGSIKNPKILGILKFNDVGFKVKQLNSQFKSINDKITFTDNKIAFDDFVIKDEKENNLTINGTLNSTDLSNIGFNLKIDSDNFKAVNSSAKDNDLYYGTLFLDNHLILKGTVNNPIVDGTMKVNKDTKFTIVLPQSDPSIADREGIVEFIDQDQPKLFTTISLNKQISQSEIKGVLAAVNIEIDKEAELSIIIDKANGDFLKLKGEAQLTGALDASGKTSLTGRYEFTEGSYEMNFNLIKRKFDIKKGSYILCTGEPTTADLNITAIYKSRTAPIDLVNDQLGNISAAQRNTYKQKIPFETELKLKGELLKPILTFNIVLPAGNNDVSAAVINTTQAKLAQLREQPDELNKQVFALLLLNRFIGENPFASESGGTTASGLARESASKILSQQLNNFAEDLVSGIEINFDLQSSEEYTSGEKQNKTDLNVGISKKLFNDRLKVTVGSSFGIEGEQQANQKASNIAGDVSVDYQLSKDGRFKVRAYRVNKYQVALQGEVVETGVAFILTIDYNKFRELFYRNANKKSANKK